MPFWDINHRCHLEEVTVPTLVISAVDDAMAAHTDARSMARVYTRRLGPRLAG